MAMEVSMELELDDDVFFADISKQLNLLITDDDEQNPISLSSSVSFQGFLRGNYQTSATTPYMMYHEQINYNNLRDQSKGTGVFIPRCSQPRRRPNHNHQKKQGRFSSFIPKQQQFSHHHVHDNNYNSKTLSNNQKRITTLHHHAYTNQRRTCRDAAALFT